MRNFVSSTENDVHMYAKFEDFTFFCICVNKYSKVWAGNNKCMPRSTHKDSIEIYFIFFWALFHFLCIFKIYTYFLKFFNPKRNLKKVGTMLGRVSSHGYEGAARPSGPIGLRDPHRPTRQSTRGPRRRAARDDGAVVDVDSGKEVLQLRRHENERW
jgi:hypothetical protein